MLCSPVRTELTYLVHLQLPGALERLQSMQTGPDPKLIRIGVKNKGCAGMSYHLDYVEKPDKWDEVVHQDGVTVVIDSKALFSVIGSEMDWEEGRVESRFIFNSLSPLPLKKRDPSLMLEREQILMSNQNAVARRASAYRPSFSQSHRIYTTPLLQHPCNCIIPFEHISQTEVPANVTVCSTSSGWPRHDPVCLSLHCPEAL